MTRVFDFDQWYLSFRRTPSLCVYINITCSYVWEFIHSWRVKNYRKKTKCHSLTCVVMHLDTDRLAQIFILKYRRCELSPRIVSHTQYDICDVIWLKCQRIAYICSPHYRVPYDRLHHKSLSANSSLSMLLYVNIHVCYIENIDSKIIIQIPENDDEEKLRAMTNYQKPPYLSDPDGGPHHVCFPVNFHLDQPESEVYGHISGGVHHRARVTP